MSTLSSSRSGLAILFSVAQRRRGLILCACLMSALSAALAFGPIFAIFEIAKRLQTSAGYSDVWFWGGFAFTAVILRLVALAISVISAHVAAFDVLFDLRLAIAEKLTRVPMGFLTQRNSGAVRKILKDDVEQIEIFIAHMLPDAAAAITAPLVAAAVLFWVDWRLGLAGLMVLPIAFVLQALMYRGSDKMMADYVAAQEAMDGALVQYIRGIAVIKAFGLTSRSFGQVRETVTAYRDIINTYSARQIPAWSAFTVVVRGSVLTLLPTGAWLASRGEITAPELILSLMAGLAFTPPLLRLIMASGQLRMIEQGGLRVAEILGAAELKPEGKATPENASVTFDAVSFAYDGTEVLKNISFTAEPGTRTALVGPSGAGKSTVALLLGRFWDVNAGAIRIGGVDIKQIEPHVLNDHVAFVFQDVFLFDGTVADNIRMGKVTASDEAVINAARAAQAHAFIERLPDGYQTQIGERGARLSGGERQRLSIARAILRDAPIVVLDEATAFADPMNEALINDAIAALTRGKTLIVIAHRLSAIANFEQILVLDQGEIVARGRHDALMRDSPLYAALWQAHHAARGWRFRRGEPVLDTTLPAGLTG